MSQISKTEQILKEVIQYNIDITAISETRWLGSGMEPLQDGHVLAYSGHENRRQAGVGVLMSPAARRAMLKWTPVNERIIYTRFWSAHGKLSIVACYAATNEADEIEKDNFYETLQSVVAEIPRHDIICVEGDLNAKVGSCHNYCPEVMGQHGIGDMNENRALLVDFALNNDLVIGAMMVQTAERYYYKIGKEPLLELISQAIQISLLRQRELLPIFVE
ncbi:hypothetical protein QYM36_001395 [Artemia franciscana]|uniref:Endonuclease/exonuclease/phosphatase domain-containing protein n=1 Tax=Artemia franciscana TaxID=6661 RepID=A0AA88LK59_ARTSF|nr:hypothetical protein QYM36_001395 [Artemia franciscana]